MYCMGWRPKRLSGVIHQTCEGATALIETHAADFLGAIVFGNREEGAKFIGFDLGQLIPVTK